MKAKDEKTTDVMVNIANEPSKYELIAMTVRGALPSNNEIRQSLWTLANFGSVVIATSTSMVAFQSPFRTLLINSMKHGTLISPAMQGVSFLMASKILYNGLGTQVRSTAARSTYVVGAKEIKKSTMSSESNESAEAAICSEENTTINKKSSSSSEANIIIGSLALGEVLVSQVGDNYSQLVQASKVRQDFPWKKPINLVRLNNNGILARFAGSFVNLTAMCEIEGVIAQAMPFSSNTANHTIAGALSGITASTITFPIYYYKDYVLLQATVNGDKLVNQSPINVAKEFLAYVQKEGMMETVKQATNIFLKQMPVRGAMTAAAFAVVSGVTAYLGDEPLKNIVPEKYQPNKVSNNRNSLFNQGNNKESGAVVSVLEQSESLSSK